VGGRPTARGNTGLLVYIMVDSVAATLDAIVATITVLCRVAAPKFLDRSPAHRWDTRDLFASYCADQAAAI
jgi:hypothetical protein